MAELKADLHTHSADDPCDDLAHSTEMLIDAAAKLNFRVLALTCHEEVIASGRLSEYARRRGVTLVPGLEACIEGKHVVILNPDSEQAAAATFQELRALGHRGAAIIAPHTFYSVSRLPNGVSFVRQRTMSRSAYLSTMKMGVGLFWNSRPGNRCRKFGASLPLRREERRKASRGRILQKPREDRQHRKETPTAIGCIRQ